MSEETVPAQAPSQSSVRGVTRHEMKLIVDRLRGNLTVAEFDRDLPFVPARYFLTFNVPHGEIRGAHAHHECKQFLLCVRGSCEVSVDDGRNRDAFVLDHPARGLYVPPMVWASERNLSADSTLLVFASHHYDPADYIRDYDEFLAAVSRS